MQNVIKSMDSIAQYLFVNGEVVHSFFGAYLLGDEPEHSTSLVSCFRYDSFVDQYANLKPFFLFSIVHDK